ncbi:excinuclease ABC subunit UvrC [Desemzia sp. RIT804]|uniref:excinuclease ABC subunit UvrC n=1 Tax=Desemzia sp. RIT 804 TaxID=2810209 RepID=UPI00194EB60B|nr:excinuclease ABC subunit UvrC [Desemzia sp. RIT 804]MBM6614647.1 excinuclease ABC subunit UvrC [Desemzia sp. RIT 804]
MVSDHINNKLTLLPELPGCYVMKNKDKEIIYIGKAKNLKNRVRSYFKGSHEGKTQLLVQEIRDFETIITKTEKESLLLEITLIKKHQPKYNIKLKQGTNYPYLKITNERDPQLIITSDVKKDGGHYFGPYPNVYAASETQQLIQKIYPLRKCNGRQRRACLYYHIGQCIGPCDHEVPVEEYTAQVNRIRRFLNGDVKEVKNVLRSRMKDAAEKLEFERAAEYRNQIQYIETTVEKQNIITNDPTPRDVFSFYMNKGWISIQTFFIRQATLIKREATIFPCYDTPDEELASYIVQFYQEKNHILPKEILVPQGMDTSVLEEVLQISVRSPFKGRKKDMLDLATKNSEIALNEKFKLIEMDDKKTVGAIKELSQVLGIPYIERIEAFDHSNIQGTSPVSAMVSFKDGAPDKSQYRKYNIKTVKGSNELATTQEVVRRRYTRLLKEGKPLPDLILMDGGKIQVNGAIDILENELGLTIPVAGMVKDNKHRTASLIFGESHQIVPLEPTSQAFYLVQRIQDEVHRFAITFHRKVRSKNSVSSRLDSIEGIGPKRRKKIMTHFKSVKNIREATIEEITSIGVPLEVAKKIKEEMK